VPPHRGALLEGRNRAEVNAAVERAVAELPSGVEVETEFHVDDPAEVLSRISEHVDLLVCGSRGYGPLRSVLLGGVSRRLVREASCPVLILPRGVEAGLEDLSATADSLTTS
jgi:nucleotide-binding universal stress UspA family protein